jgi:hypothetical protein
MRVRDPAEDYFQAAVSHLSRDSRIDLAIEQIDDALRCDDNTIDPRHTKDLERAKGILETLRDS